MVFKETTEYGSIKYDYEIPGNIAKRVAGLIDGKPIFSTPKGRPLRTSGRPTGDDYSFMETEFADGKINITIYVILRFGYSIKDTVAELADGIRAEVPGILGVAADRIRVVVTGIQSKNLSKRNIVVDTYADPEN